MIGASLIERPIVRYLEDALGDEAGPFAHRLREAALTAPGAAARTIRDRLGDDGPLTGVKVIAQEDVLRGVLDLSDTIYWMMGSVCARGTALSETAMMATRGGPLDRVVAHRWLDGCMTAADIRRANATSIIDVEGETMALSQVRGWPQGL